MRDWEVSEAEYAAREALKVLNGLWPKQERRDMEKEHLRAAYVLRAVLPVLLAALSGKRA